MHGQLGGYIVAGIILFFLIVGFAVALSKKANAKVGSEIDKIRGKK